ncbi:MAG: flagellar basal body protein [Flavobacteriaceae bacterium]
MSYRQNTITANLANMNM